jgi:hypothetical protein
MTADWSRKFDSPIPLPKGRQLVTLKDAGTHITKLPKSEHTAAERQAAMEALILVATLGGPTMFARIGIMLALNRGYVREFTEISEHSVLCGGRPHAVNRPTAGPAPPHANQPYRRRYRDRRERYNDFLSLFAAGHLRDRRFDGGEERSAGISDLPAHFIP